MRIKAVKLIGIILSLVLVVLSFNSCSLSDLISKNSEKPAEARVKTDLKDAVFTFSYGELRNTIRADIVAAIFENYDELNDGVTIEMSYNEIVNRFENGEDDDEFKKMMALCSEEELAQLTANTHEVLEYFVEHINSVKAQKPIVQYTEGFWTKGDSFSFRQGGEDSDSKIAAAAKYFDYFVTKGVSNYFDNEENGKKGTTEKGDDLTDIMYLYGEDVACRLTDDDVEKVVSSLMYDYTEYSEKYTDENGREKTRDVRIPTKITRVITIILKDDEQSVTKAFSLGDKKAILDEMAKAKDYFTLDDYSVTFDGCKIVATFNAATDNILSATYDKVMNIETEVKGVGSLEHIGTQTVGFTCTRWVDYQFGWEAEAE